jgi:hypothetical protein
MTLSCAAEKEAIKRHARQHSKTAVNGIVKIEAIVSPQESTRSTANAPKKKKGKGPYTTPEQDIQIRKLYATMTAGAICKHLGLKMWHFNEARRRLGISRGHRGRRKNHLHEIHTFLRMAVSSLDRHLSDEYREERYGGTSIQYNEALGLLVDAREKLGELRKQLQREKEFNT